MKLSTIIFGILVACVANLSAQNGPLLNALQPEDDYVREVVVVEPQTRQKRSLLLGEYLFVIFFITSNNAEVAWKRSHFKR